MQRAVIHLLKNCSGSGTMHSCSHSTIQSFSSQSKQSVLHQPITPFQHYGWMCPKPLPEA